jgi:transposase
VKKKNKMTICIGIDVHKKKCMATLKRDSQIVEQTSFYNNGHGIKEFIEHIKLYNESAIAVCESTGNYWIRLHDTLEDNGIDTILANPIKTKIIAEAKLKDDKIDSNVLADLLRADLVYRSFVPDKEHRELRQIVRTRVDLAATKTSIKNKVHAILAKYDYSCPTNDIFSQKAIQWLKTVELSWIDRMAVDAYLETMFGIEKQIKIFTAKIASISKDDERVKLLMTIPGIDYITALTIVSEIVDIRRFSTPWKLVGYAGLAPSKRESGTTHRTGYGRRITRQGSRWIRFTIVESATTAIMYDNRISKFYRRIASRRGPQKAKVAAAKEMLVIVWHMLTKNEPYRTMNNDLVQRKYKRMERESVLA